MIDSFLAILDRLIKLLALRERRQNRLFLELWEPTFTDLLIVHRDYIKMFETTKAMLLNLMRVPSTEEGDKEILSGIREVVQYLTQQRIEFEPVRLKLIALLEAVPKSGLDEKSSVFVDAVVSYFPIGVLRRPTTAVSEMLPKIQVQCKIIEDSGMDDEITRMSLNDLFNYVNSVIRQHRQAWSIVCEAYAPLRISHAKRAPL